MKFELKDDSVPRSVYVLGGGRQWLLWLVFGARNVEHFGEERRQLAEGHPAVAEPIQLRLVAQAQCLQIGHRLQYVLHYAGFVAAVPRQLQQ